MESITGSGGVRGTVESQIGGRKENQDSYGMADTKFGLLVVVCDGMGGGPAGKTASSLATQAILDYVSGAPGDKDAASVLEDAAVAANESLLAAINEDPSLKGMGTTCVCVLIGKQNAYIVHVGDSRCYQLRAGKAVFRTADHSYVGELVRRGTMSEEEARTSRFSNVITRAVGIGADLVPETDVVPYKLGDRFALMSDGIWGSMPENQLVVLLCSSEDINELVPEMCERVENIGQQKGGGHDNLTLAMVEIPGGPKKTLNDRFVRAQETAMPQEPEAVSSLIARDPNQSVTATPVSQNEGAITALSTANDRRGNTQQRQQPADYNIESAEHEIKPRRMKKLVYVLAACLLAAVCVIVYLLVFVNKEELKENAKGTKPRTETIDTREGEPVVSEEVKQNLEALEKSYGGKGDSKEDKKETKKERNADKINNANNASEIVESQTANKLPPQVLKELTAMKTVLLSMTDTYEKPPVDRDQRLNDRKKKVKKMLDKLKATISEIEDRSKRESIESLYKEMKDDHNKIAGIARKDSQPSKECVEAVDKYVKKIDALLK